MLRNKRARRYGVFPATHAAPPHNLTNQLPAILLCLVSTTTQIGANTIGRCRCTCVIPQPRAAIPCLLLRALGATSHSVKNHARKTRFCVFYHSNQFLLHEQTVGQTNSLVSLISSYVDYSFTLQNKLLLVLTSLPSYLGCPVHLLSLIHPAF